MKKRTSRSASATPQTSSPSGTSEPTAATGRNHQPKRKKKRKPRGMLAPVVARIDAMTPEEFIESLVAAGIIQRNGELTDKYKQPG